MVIGLRTKGTLAALIAALLLAPGIGTTIRAQQKLQVIPPEAAQTTTMRKAVDTEIDALAPRLFEMTDFCYKNPEPGYEEFKASAMFVDELKKQGFVVETGVPGLPENFDRLKLIGGMNPKFAEPKGMPTAFKAKYKGKSDKPVIGIAVEYDALRGSPSFHGCQHDMQGPTGIGAAVALAKVMEKNNIPGSVWVIGTPAEEIGPPAKAAQAKAGYYDGVDFMLRSHGTSNETIRYPGGFASRHIRQTKYTFHGKSAHAQGAWEGVSAFDAALLFFHAAEMYREHSEPQFRFHGIMPEAGEAPNVVPAQASVLYWVRHLMDETPLSPKAPAKAAEMINAKVAQLDAAAKGAAMATGTTVDIDHYGEYNPGIGVGAMQDIMFQYAIDYGGINPGERKVAAQWEETGFGTMIVPGVQVHIGLADTPDLTGHSQEAADQSVSPAGHKSLVLTSKVMAATALRLVTDQTLRDKVKAEHASWLAKYKGAPAADQQ